MAGLLDTFFGTPDQTRALGLLGAGMMNGGFAKGAPMAMEYMAGADDRRLKRGLLEAQVEETRAQAQERKLKQSQFERQLEMDRHFFGMGGPGVPGAQPTVPTSTGAPMPAGGFTAQQISQQFGVPIEAVMADYRFNGGKKIAELISERTKPNWQNINGNLVNTNAPGFQGGLQAGVSAGNNGQVTAWQPDGRGGLVVGAPQGAFETFGRYQNIQQGAAADFDPLTITPPGGRPVMRSRGSVMREANMPAPQPGVNGAFVGDPAAVSAAIAGIRDPQERANAQAAFESQMRANGGQLGGIPLQSKAEETAAVEQAKADVVPTPERQSAQASADYLLNTIGKALVHKGRETATGMSGALDPRNYMPGTKAKDFRVLLDQIQGSAFLEAYKSLKGGGAITEVEGAKAEKAIARLNTAQSDGEFESALREFQSVVKAGSDRLKAGGAPMQLPPNPNPQNLVRGKSYALPGGKVGTWDGMGFKVQ